MRFRAIPVRLPQVDTDLPQPDSWLGHPAVTCRHWCTWKKRLHHTTRRKELLPEGSVTRFWSPTHLSGSPRLGPWAETREPLGPLYPVARESFRAQPHPRCLPPRSPSLPSDGCYPSSCEGGEAPLVVRPHRPHRNRFDTFLTAGATTLTKSLPEAQSV
jgi:hypothetical protein